MSLSLADGDYDSGIALEKLCTGLRHRVVVLFRGALLTEFADGSVLPVPPQRVGTTQLAERSTLSGLLKSTC